MKLKRKTWWKTCFLLLLVFACNGCKDEKNEEGGGFFNPSQKIRITGFNPESAGGGANFFIYGENFGTDPSIIEVTINDKVAPVIGANGNTIYCMIPEKVGTGLVKVKIGTEKGGFQEEISENEFKYQGELRVGTLAGWVDKDGKSTTLDGSLEEAQFQNPFWMTFDNEKNILLVQTKSSVRKINFRTNKVETLFYIRGDLNHPRTLTFSPDYDTLYIANDNGNREGMAVAYALRKDEYKKWARLVTGGWCNGAAVQPQDGTVFYNSWELAQLYKWKRGTQEGDLLFRVGAKAWEFNIQFEPDGNYAYIVCKNQHYIMKSFYDKERKVLLNPSLFVGTKKSYGHADGVGTGSKFDQPHQGCFDEEGNFYVCDVFNHCIRKITPDGMVTTFAGQPRKSGYADGALRNQSLFNKPSGILYDKENKIFYIADEGNHRIRTIKIE